MWHGVSPKGPLELPRIYYHKERKKTKERQACPSLASHHNLLIGLIEKGTVKGNTSLSSLLSFPFPFYSMNEWKTNIEWELRDSEQNKKAGKEKSNKIRLGRIRENRMDNQYYSDVV